MDVKLLQKEVDCLSREKHLLEKYVSELEFSNGVLKSKMPSASTSASTANSLPHSSTGHSYAQAVKTVNTSAVLVIKSADQNMENSKLEQELKSKFRPGSMNANVIGTRLIKDGLLISCEDIQSLQNLKDGLKREVGNVYNIYEPKKLRPKIIVHSVDKSVADDPDLSDAIIKDNHLDVPTSDIRVVTKLKFKYSVNVVLEVTPVVYKKAISSGFLYVGWKRCYVQDHFNIIRCFKCNKFGHHKKDCKSASVVCPNCSGNHEKRDCISTTFSCVNCKHMNNKMNTNYPTDHSATSLQCLCLRNKIDQLKSRIQYE
nr:unnamed protein product [Callosobruchus analis]